MKIPKEAKIGLIITLVLVVFIWGLNFLKGRNLFTTSNQYYAIFNSIGGLEKSAKVGANGYTLGIVSDITFFPGNYNKILVEISVDRQFKLPKNTLIEVYSADFMGSKAINLILGNSTALAKDKDTLESKFEGDLNTLVTKKLMPIKDKAENMIVSIDSVMTIIRTTFNPETKRNVQRSIAAMDDLIVSQKAKIALILDHLEMISKNLSGSNKSITNIANNLSTISDSLAKADLKKVIDQTNVALTQSNDILMKVNKGKGTIGQMINNDSLYVALEKTVKDLDILLNDLNKNPKRYVHFSVFGKKDVISQK